jgi:hypothetical protein
MKKIILSMALLACCSWGFANPVDVQTAKTVASHFIAGKLDASQLELLSTYGEPQAAFYIFNINQDQGFVIVSADDIIMPVLGYSTEGAFVNTNISPEVRYWLEGYKGQIEYAVAQGAQADQATTDKWAELLAATPATGNTAAKVTSVSPLLTTKWDQMPYYNNFCPVPGGNYNSTPSGCVATAMAQIMNYWQYPVRGNGSHTYSSSTVGGQLSANFNITTYSWSNMPNELTSSSPLTQVNAIATLMYQCGVAVEMNYDIAGNGGSGAMVINYGYPDMPCSQNALVDYFGYSNTIQGYERANFSDASWIAMLQSELDNGRPLLYTGFGDLGGHAFDFDGYDANNMFHINWGWSGMSNGYFTINDLAPSALGVGGGGGNFNYYQEALIGIMPKPTGIEQANLASGYSIYPNPAKDNLHIMLTAGPGQLQSIGLYDIQGKELLKRDNLNRNSLDIPVNSYADGIYILKLQSDKGIATQKILIQK